MTTKTYFIFYGIFIIAGGAFLGTSIFNFATGNTIAGISMLVALMLPIMGIRIIDDMRQNQG